MPEFTSKEFLLIIMAIFYLVAGITHFIVPKFYYKAMPPFIAREQRKPINIFVGIVEILAGIGLLIPMTRSWAAIGVIVLLLGVLPVHTHMVRDPKPAFKVPLWLLWARIPIQFLLIAWAAWYITF